MTPFSYDEFHNRYYVHRIGVSVIVVNEKRELLLAYQFQRSKRKWGLPGGLIEKEESLIDALFREVKEETNIEIELVGILAVINWAGPSIFKDDPYNHNGFTFIVGAKYLSGEIKADQDEVFDVKFVSPEEFDQFEVSNWIKDFYLLFLEKKILLLSKTTVQSPKRFITTFVGKKNWKD
jgi:8-oxo-dGTP pyrophosphatase MutT (NUDIX family)